jgi:hypothetical protein
MFHVVCKIIISPTALYEYETWSLIINEEQRLKVFENMVLRRIFWIKEG